ncbi:MAG: 3-deoxy-manno-octulosonate cytidylyltransferase [Bacteroidota bacterium]|nr:3-deoxy-manno-octulosonate cytidylyltransferase [Bacteroidota bacterium]MDP4232206.1 3-deoxy-manno-octulosonate cytidylyltransferase [Bacteroidota bacterium]MDP4243613.1 3-deoxy-manno-octulosonate cytidylyltransferase [Bacteroidota bacterium]MDP4288734.1 3-deoxy-manno-octulosonate cytidylyltransferase [Bacteroidota bacterium]
MTVVIIPARYASTRLPGKPLAIISGMTMIERVYRQCENAQEIDAVFVATDHPAIVQEVERFGGRAVMTSPECPSGTDRVFEAAQILELPDSAIVINVQGDEPLIDPKVITALARAMQEDDTIQVATPISPLTREEEITNPNVVTVVRNTKGDALYFSRTAIPYHRDTPTTSYLKHVGVYAYRMEALRQFVLLGESHLERKERLEQLRLLEAGIPIRCVEVEYESVAVDSPEDIEKVEQRLQGQDGVNFSA